MTQVFISYSRKDLAFVEQLAADLKNAGFDVWYDVSGIGGGSRWRIEIETAIRNSQFVIVVLSPDSVVSEWVEREFLFSSQHKRKIIPLLYKPCELPLNYLNLNYINVEGKNYRQNFADLLRALDIIPTATTIPSAKAKKPSFSLKTGCALAIIVVIGIFAVLLVLPQLERWFTPGPITTVTVTLTETTFSTDSPLPTATTPIPSTKIPESVPTNTELSTSTVQILAIRETVFDGPGYAYDPIFRLEAGARLTAIGKGRGDVQGDWIQILLPSGGTGWINDNPDRIERNFSLDALPGGTISPVPEVDEPRQIFPTAIDEINSLSNSMGITWDGNHLWQVNRSENGWLNELDNRGNILRQWPLAGPYSGGLTFDGQFLWYAETNVSRIFRINLDTGQALQQFHTPGWGNIYDLAWDGEFLWAASFQPYRLYKVDPATGEEVESLDGPVPPGYGGVIPSFESDNDTSLRISGLTWDGLFLWVGETSTSEVMKFNPYNGSIVSYFTTDLDNLYGLAWDGTYLWASDWSGNIIKYQP